MATAFGRDQQRRPHAVGPLEERQQDDERPDGERQLAEPAQDQRRGSRARATSPTEIARATPAAAGVPQGGDGERGDAEGGELPAGVEPGERRVGGLRQVRAPSVMGALNRRSRERQAAGGFATCEAASGLSFPQDRISSPA